MAKSSTLTEQQKNHIRELHDTGLSVRKIAEQLGIKPNKVYLITSKKTEAIQQEKIAALVSKPVVQETRKSVFDIIARLEDCLDEIEDLKDTPGQLKDRVAVRTEKRMLIAEARATLESIYNIKLLNDFIDTVTTILESEAPGSRKRIFDRLEQSVRGFAAISLFASNRTGRIGSNPGVGD
ncbi:MAG: hypothetical protein J0I20_35825 [Chloroflexi bacterium]|nr:hypothetical protein [Chloroflexota bacterium]OJV86976.1 MAG: hypothetical protein BGO39_28650 [Chloroflexi bacterium 54-19]